MNNANYYYNKSLKEIARRLRKESTKAEVKLWNEVLRSGQIHGYKFLRQRPVLKYVVDFMCKELKLIIEVDGKAMNGLNNGNWIRKDRKNSKKLISLF